MRIHFVLPTHGANPVGGYKVVYEYANGLQRMGHAVTVSHAHVLARPAWAELRRPRVWAAWAKSLVTGRHLPSPWFQVDAAVSMRLVPCLHACWAPPADVVVATSWETAEWVARWPQRCGRPFYLIQHFEDWSGDARRVLATWRLPLRKVVIAQWLADIAVGQGETACVVPNGLDFSAFGVDRPVAGRTAPRALMLHHEAAWKGSAAGIHALALVRAQRPDLQATLFGVRPRPVDLPGWIVYEQLPSPARLRALYNDASVFLGPSRTEGWGLPPCEAMMSGAAVVLTDIGGHREFARPDDNCLMVPVDDAPAMAAALLRLLDEPALRERLANQALQDIRAFTWARAVAQFEQVLTSA